VVFCDVAPSWSYTLLWHRLLAFVGKPLDMDDKPAEWAGNGSIAWGRPGRQWANL